MASDFVRLRHRRTDNTDYRRMYPRSVFRRKDNIFYSKYRFRSINIGKIVRMLSPLLPENGFEPWVISKENQVLITLRYPATNSHQTVIADIFGVSQKAVSDVITRVINAYNHPAIEERFLRFWVDDEQWCFRRSREFARRSKFTNVVGCVDGCLISIQRPINHGNHYFCQKACCAVNIVAVGDARARFTYITVDSLASITIRSYGEIHLPARSLKKAALDAAIGCQKLIKECVLLYNTGIYLGTHRGQTVPLRVRGVMTHPPSNTSVREYVTANL
ncbi:hypothetical protein Aduo_009713 [Ancylostoma duodenale]